MANDIKSVMNDLERCTHPSPVTYCYECTHKGIPDDCPHCFERLANDALKLLTEYKDNLRVMFNRCHTLIHSCDACTIRKTCKQLRDVDKKVGERLA